MIAEIRAAIEATTLEDWSSSAEGDVDIWTASSQGWTILLMSKDDTADGTATRDGHVVHLTPELVDLARGKLISSLATAVSRKEREDEQRRKALQTTSEIGPPGADPMRDLDQAAELETQRLIDEARAELPRPIKGVGLEGPGVDEVRHHLGGHGGFENAQFYSKDDEWSRSLEPPAWRIRRMRKGEVESLVPPAMQPALAKLKARRAPGKLLRAAVIFFFRDGGVDYRVRIPTIQTKAGKWAVLNINDGSIMELDAMDELAASVTSSALKKHVLQNEQANWRTSCAGCKRSFETGPVLALGADEEAGNHGPSAFVHPGCWDEEPLLNLSAFLAKGVTVPRARAVTRAAGDLALRMNEEGPYAILQNWTMEWEVTRNLAIRQLLAEEIKDKAGTITDLSAPDLAGMEFNIGLDEDVLALAREAGVDVEAEIIRVIERGLASANQGALKEHAKKILEQQRVYLASGTKGHTDLAPAMKDLVLALTVESFGATGVRTDLASAKHPLRKELAKALVDWTSLRGITEDQASAIVDREIGWWNRGCPKCTEWQDECCVCDEAIDYGPVVRLETSECHLACYAIDDPEDSNMQTTPDELVTDVRFAFTDRSRWDEASVQDRYEMLLLADSAASLAEVIGGAWEGSGPHGIVMEPERACENWEQLWPGLVEQAKARMGARKAMDVIKGTSKTWPFDAIWILYGSVYDREAWACMGCGVVDLIRTVDLEVLEKGTRTPSGSISSESWRCPRCNPDPEWAPSQGTRVRLKKSTGDTWGEHGPVFGPGDVGVVTEPARMNVILPDRGHWPDGFGLGLYTGTVGVMLPGNNEAAELGRSRPIVAGKNSWITDVKLSDECPQPRVLLAAPPSVLEVIQTPCTKKAPCWGKLRCRRHSKQATRLYGGLDVSAALGKVTVEFAMPVVHEPDTFQIMFLMQLNSLEWLEGVASRSYKMMAGGDG